ncbi:site-specific DNA-methyltransferase [Moorella naiadis]|uniref:DNA methyltransferase n=1 Tax=Moorella naiadis (nom. illeg.) TaxID=3093670 RepID=UPI003D9C9632
MVNQGILHPSARLVWATKPEGEPHSQEIGFQVEEVVIPEQEPTFFTPADATLHIREINRLFHGDNLLAMQGLLAQGYEGKINLIYIDPPFYSQAKYTHRITPGRTNGSWEIPVIELPAYQDTWGGGIDSYLDMLYPRLQLMYRLLTPDGSIYVHLDASISHYIKVLMDEIFGLDSFQREIIWRIGWISGYKSAARNWVRNHDNLLFYVKNPGKFTFNKEYLPYPPGYRRRDGQKATGKGYPIEDVWNANPCELALKGEESLDSIQIKSFSREKSGFATQKNKSLLRRIIKASSNPGDLVADFFGGSGTTLVVAAEIGRRWLGCEIGRTGIQVARKRLVAAGAGPFSIERVKPTVKPAPGAGPSEGSGYQGIPVAKAATRSGVNCGISIPAGDCFPRTATPNNKAGENLRLTGPEVMRTNDGLEQLTIGLAAYTPPEPAEKPRSRKTKASWETLQAHARENFSLFIDYWAVDWDYDGSCFRSRWRAWKDYNKNEAVPLQAIAILPPGGRRTIAVQVVDIFGNEVLATLDVPPV